MVLFRGNKSRRAEPQLAGNEPSVRASQKNIRRGRREMRQVSGGFPPQVRCWGAWAYETEGPGAEAREHRPLSEASGRAHRTTTPGPRSCSAVLAGSRAAPQAPGAD